MARELDKNVQDKYREFLRLLDLPLPSEPPEPLSLEQAKERCLPGWNLRCNLCGSYGAGWVPKGRPGWGSLALCPRHETEYRAVMLLSDSLLARFRQVKYRQPIPRYQYP